MPEAEPPVLDTVVLRVMAFAHPDGLAILLRALKAMQGRFPTEVYAQDEATLPPQANDELLSELARGLRYARRRAEMLPPAQAVRYQTWLENAQQLPRHLARGSLFEDPLDVSEILSREALMTEFGIDRGEAACLVLAGRAQVPALFLSADELACQAAKARKIPYLTLLDVLEAWVEDEKPDPSELEKLIEGMCQAKYGLTVAFAQRLKEQL